jgi:hypothetical protein
MLLGLGFGVAAWSLFFLGHLAAMRFAMAAERARLDRLLFLVGLLSIPIGLGGTMPFLQSSVLTHGGWFMGALWGILGYFALFTLYMPFFYTVATSLSVCTIVLLVREVDGKLPVSELSRRFASRTLVEDRLAVMAQNGLLSRQGDIYRLESRARLIARTFSALKRFWRLGAGG